MTQKSKKELEPVEEKKSLVAPTKKEAGYELSREDIQLPSALLMQDKSPQVKEEADVVAGMIINSLTKKPIGEYFIPLGWKKVWIRKNAKTAKEPGFDPNFAPEAVMYKCSDVRDPRVIADKEWGSTGDKPLATEYIQVLAYFPGDVLPTNISFCKSSLKHGKNFLTNAGLMKQGQPYEYRYKVVSKEVTSKEGHTYFEILTQDAGKSSEEERNIAKNLRKVFDMSKDLNIHEEVGDSADPVQD